jgi:signal transduction histidine kinase
VQTGRIVCTPAPFVLTGLLSDLSLVCGMAANKGVALDVQFPAGAIITADRNILSTVVRNLLNNAVKFTPAGGTVTLEIQASPPTPLQKRGENSPPSEGLGEASFSITDTGIGMSREQLRNLFRLDSARSRPGTAGEQGTGLGLIACRELLEKHGSALHVESEEGRGSRFFFELKVES